MTPMKNMFDKMNSALMHLRVLHEVFAKGDNFRTKEKVDYAIYHENNERLIGILKKLDFGSQLYGEKGRQMILADLFEYILLGRGYYSIQSEDEKMDFVRLILYFVNLLMCYEVTTVSDNLRKKVLEKLGEKVREIGKEGLYGELKDFTGTVGLRKGESTAAPHLDRYFDSMLPKTAGGLWHELLVYTFLIRNDFGYIIPLLLSQRLMSLNDSIVPPDFLIITHDKHIYGIEVGTKKEIQSGSFSLQTAIPTATIDTINSRTSDRCPICKRWIPFCEFVVNNYSNFDIEITKAEVRCLEECNIYSRKDIAAGKCPYMKYSRNKAQTLVYAQHEYASGLHYHYRCVLEKVPADVRKRIVDAEDTVALKTHYPYYSGLEELMEN